MDHTIARKAVWAQRGAPKWAYGWQGRQLWRSGAHRGGILGEPKMLKNRETRGTAAGGARGAQEGYRFRPAWAHRNGLPGEPKMLKNRESRGTAAGAQERAQEGCRFRLAWAHRNGLPGEHKTRITRDSGSERSRARSGRAAAGPPCGDSTEWLFFYTPQEPSSETLLGNY